MLKMHIFLIIQQDVFTIFTKKCGKITICAQKGVHVELGLIVYETSGLLLFYCTYKIEII